MDFREREMDFREANRRYAELVRQRDAGSISQEEFDARRQQLVVKDDAGRSWTKFGEAGTWRYHDGSAWVPSTPPGGSQEDASESTTIDGRTRLSLDLEGVEDERRQRMPLWIPVAGLGGMLLLGIVLIIWVLVPYLWGDADLDAGLVHRATSENISGNSTYLDDPLINDDPNVILYVTQNWNPGGGGNGIYNDHPIGVWYDSNLQRWAIFNQDGEAMPEGAAFNVAVLQ